MAADLPVLPALCGGSGDVIEERLRARVTAVLTARAVLTTPGLLAAWWERMS